MANWSELQSDVLVHIGRHLNLIEEYLNFASVCKPWRRVATKSNFNSDLPRVPWLMLPEGDDNKSSCREFFSLCNGMILKKSIPRARGKRCLESLGWFITVGKDEGEISLLHPFSGVQIELPHQNTTEDYARNKTRYIWTYIHKAVLSADPSKTSDYVLMVIEGEKMHLSFWRPGDLRWTRVRVENFIGHRRHRHRDVVCFSGKFYAVDWLGQVLVCDVTRADPTKAQRVAQLPNSMDIYQMGEEYYILESLGSLLVVVRHGGLCFSRIPLTHVPYAHEVHNEEEVPESNGHLNFQTNGFRVYKVDLAAGKLTETRQLGDGALFLGANASLSVQASQFPGIKPNHIYFTDDCYEAYSDYEEGGGLDMGVFNLSNGTFDHHYKGLFLNRFTPPIWVTPTPC